MRPVFYCESCKREVSANDKICPRCGRFFSDVRCPRCNHCGVVEDFSFGCPKCGYLNPAWAGGEAVSASPFIEIVSPKVFEGTTPYPDLPRRAALRLPAWFFLSLTLGLGTLCAALVYLYLH